MKNSIRLLAVFLAALFLFSGVALAAPDAKALFEAANENLANATSYELSHGTKLDMRVFGEKLTIESKTTIKYLNDPKCLQITEDSKIFGSSSKTTVYGQEEDGVFAVYTSYGKSVTRDEEALDKVDMTKASSTELNELLKKQKKLTYVSTEKINKKSAHVLHATILAADVEKLLLDTFKTAEERRQVRKMLKGMGDMTIKIYIDEATGQFARVEIDMADMMRGIYKAMLPDTDEFLMEEIIQIKEYYISLDYKNINKVKPFSVPKSIVNKAK